MRFARGLTVHNSCHTSDVSVGYNEESGLVIPIFQMKS